MKDTEFPMPEIVMIPLKDGAEIESLDNREIQIVCDLKLTVLNPPAFECDQLMVRMVGGRLLVDVTDGVVPKGSQKSEFNVRLATSGKLVNHA